MSRKKVLIIVGGGVFGAIPAHFLSMVPTEDMKRIDLLAGCSIGGILAAGYATGRSFAEIDEVFQARANDCFDKRWQAVLNPLSNPTYKASSLDGVLREMIGDSTVGDVRKVYPQLDLVIPSLNLTDKRYKVWDNIEGKDDSAKLVDVAGFTSAAPSYYEGRECDGKCHVDGGLIEVAPLFTAVTALHGKRKVPYEDMDVLMIGTGEEANDDPMTTKKYNGLTIMGLAKDVMVPYATLANKLATIYWGGQMGFHSFNYFDPCTISGGMDDVDLIPGLVRQCDSYREEFLEAWEKFMAWDDKNYFDKVEE